MKVIGKTQNGFLVEASEDELAKCAGFETTWHMPIIKDRHPRTWHLGDEIKVTETHTYLGKLRANERQVKDSAQFLRAMADMVAGALPSTIVPAEPPAAPAEQDAVLR